MFEKYDKPIIKTATEIKRGDVIRCEFGDWGNWIEVVFESCRTNTPSVSTEIKYHTFQSNKTQKMYDIEPIEKVKFEVIGEEKNNVK